MERNRISSKITGKKAPCVWFIRPWIEDFSAYDHFAQPYGFLSLASCLRSFGVLVYYLDCLNELPVSRTSKTRPENTGSAYRSELIEKPTHFKSIPRYYKRYGMALSAFQKTMDQLPSPDLILITTGMTYWWGGLDYTIRELRSRFSDTLIALGGVYATLCPDHAAQRKGADKIHVGPPDSDFLEWLSDAVNFPFDTTVSIRNFPPAWDLVPERRYGIVSTSSGCNHGCAYCASANLYSGFTSHPADIVDREINTILTETTARDIALYDDDLAHEPHLTTFLKRIAEKKYSVRWHLPNAISIQCIQRETAQLMKECGFVQPRLSVTHFDKHLGADGFDTQTRRRISTAAENLRAAGYRTEQVSAYILAGLPNQQLGWLKEASNQLLDAGINPYFSQFSPIPGRVLGDLRLAQLGYTENRELLLTNKILSVYQHPGWTHKEYYDLVSEIQKLRA